MVEISISQSLCGEPVPTAFVSQPAAEEDKQWLDDMEEAPYLKVAAVTLSHTSEGERGLQQNVCVVVGSGRTRVL